MNVVSCMLARGSDVALNAVIYMRVLTDILIVVLKCVQPSLSNASPFACLRRGLVLSLPWTLTKPYTVGSCLYNKSSATVSS